MIFNNTYYFYQQLKNLGFDKLTIQRGTGLALETIDKIERNNGFILNEEQFSLLLGFYCVEVCKRKSYQYKTKPSKAMVFQQLFTGYKQTNVLTYLQHHFRVKQKKQLLIQNKQQQISYLTIREQQVLFYLLQGIKKVKVADKLNISVRTIDYHCERLCTRLKLVHYRQIVDQWYVTKDKSFN